MIVVQTTKALAINLVLMTIMAFKDLIVLNMEPKSNNDSANAGICTMESMGFRLNPYFNYSYRIAWTLPVDYLASKLYSKVGIRMIINNDF
jgi:hypothetical protein